MKRLFIEPLDVLMFRSEKPFTAREAHVAKIGVISPLTFEGAIKTKIFIDLCKKRNYSPEEFQRRSKNGESEQGFKNRIKRKIETNSELKKTLELIGYPVVESNKSNPKLNVIGVFFAEKDKRVEHFPIPNDTVKEDKENGEIVKILPQQVKLAGNELQIILAEKYSKIENLQGIIEFDELKKYLWGNIPKSKKIKCQDRELKYPYFKEVRTGIKLERRNKRAEEGYLYTAEFVRLLSNWGFIVWYDIPPSLSVEGIIRLGGEGRGAICEEIKERELNRDLNTFELVEKLNENGEFKLYLAVPCYFGGWKPPKEELKKILDVEQLELRAGLPGKPIYIGGYNFALNKEKPLKRWVNAGAVYYFKFKGKIREDLEVPVKILNGNVDMRCGFIGAW